MDKGYSLIIDESIQVVERLNVSHQDFNLIMTQLTDPGDDGRLVWRNKDYSGRFSDYKALADTGSLVTLDSALLNILNPTLLSAFNEVFMLTYMFDGQYQKAYLDYYGIPYTIVGVEEDKRGFFFSNKPDSPPTLDFTNLINLSCGKKRMTLEMDTTHCPRDGMTSVHTVTQKSGCCAMGFVSSSNVKQIVIILIASGHVTRMISTSS